MAAEAFYDWQVLSSLASSAHGRILEEFREKQAEIPAREQRNCIYLRIYLYQFSPFTAPGQSPYAQAALQTNCGAHT